MNTKRMIDEELVAPSTVTGWKKAQAPKLAIALDSAWRRIEELERENTTLREAMNLARWV